MTELYERWKPIKGYEGHYEISNLGRVRSLKWGKTRIMKQSKNNDGYYEIGLTLNCVKKSFRVHRLVAQAFIPNPNGLPIINHLDCNPANNIVSNLEWTDAKENANYFLTKENMSKSQLNNPNRSKIVLQYTIDGKFVREWPSLAEIQRTLNYKAGNICKHIQGQFSQMYGFIWRYAS